MKKEQILLIVAAAIVALLLWGNSGLYSSVNAGAIKGGNDVPVTDSPDYDPRAGLDPQPAAKGRNLLKQRRMVVRLPFPEEMPNPARLPLVWTRPLPAPTPAPSAWGALRETIAAVTPAEDADDADTADDSDTDDGDDPFAEKNDPIDLTQVAQLVRLDGSEIPCDITPTGAFEGRPVWKLLEEWPNVTFRVSEYRRNAKQNDRNPYQGHFTLTPAELAGAGSRFQTIHLERTCDNEYHEKRIRDGIRDDDREALRELARWCADELTTHTGRDQELPYGVQAMKKAITTAEKARALSADMALIRTLGSYYRAAYDLEGELRVYSDYMQAGHAEDPSVLKLVAGAYEQVAAWGPARALWEKAAASGDIDARLGLANNYYRTGELAAASAEYDKVQGASGPQRAHALAGGARILIRQGDFAGALDRARRAQETLPGDAALLDTLGAAQYYTGDFAAAEKSFETAAALSSGDSRPRSNRGFALIALGRLADAKREFEACLEQDALNFVDPLIGLGDVAQRQGQLTASSDHFEAARRRDPKNPWILLRLATAKMRDGVPQRALELARELVKSSPSCVDGLRLAGLAATELGSAEAREEAVGHLANAAAKEPKNVETLYQYATALVRAERAAEALRLLEAATAPRTGMAAAREDARILALLAYARFVNRSEMETVLDAIDRGLRRNPDEATNAYLQEIKQIIVDWDRKRVWTDTFQRSTGQSVYGGWDEDDQRLGVKVALDGSHCVINGRATGEAVDRVGTSLSRIEDLQKFIEVEAAFKVSRDTRFTFHIYKGSLPTGEQGSRGRQGSELGFEVDRNGVIRIPASVGAGRKNDWTNPEVQAADGSALAWPQDGQFHTVRIERVDDKAGRYQVYLDGEPLLEEPREIGGLASQKNQKYTLGFLVDADRGTQVDVVIDYVRLVRTVD